MYITFNNNRATSRIMVSAENQKQIICPGESADIFFNGEKNEFIVQTLAFNELNDAVNEFDNDNKNESFKDRVLFKLTKKFIQKMPEIVLDTSVKYEFVCADLKNSAVNLCEGTYSVCDGKIADFFELMPVGFVFARAETECGEINVIDVTANNRKSFLKLMRNLLLFSHIGIIFVDLFLLIPEYLLIKLLSSHFFIKRLFAGFYGKTADERDIIFSEKEKQYEMEEKGGCLGSIVKVIIFLLIFGGICFWVITSEPDVIISEDFQSVICFDETFLKIDGGLPADAEKSFLEDYTAYYPTDDEGGYDMDNYYCYIYETPDGTRYMWLKDNCSKEENADKDYNDYENPLVYKSTD